MDARKAKSNLRKHGLDFEEASTVFLDLLALTFPDPGRVETFGGRRKDFDHGTGVGEGVGEKLCLTADDGGIGVDEPRRARAIAGTNLVLIEPDLAKIFPDSAAVNRTPRVVAEAAQAIAPAKRRARVR